MTLRRAVVNLGKAAQKPGVLFVALSRVRHPDDLMLDDNFPDFRQLMRVRRNEAFKQRQLWEKQRHADFSRTIRKHCRDAELFGAQLAWSAEESAVADQLLRSVRTLPNGNASADWLPAARAEMPSVSLAALGAVWERLQSFPHNVEVAEARGALDNMELADARTARGQSVPARAVAVAPTVATAAADATQTLPTIHRSETTLAATKLDVPLGKCARQAHASPDEPRRKTKRAKYAFPAQPTSKTGAPPTAQQLSVPITEQETSNEATREAPAMASGATSNAMQASGGPQAATASLLKRRRVIGPMPADTTEASDTFLRGSEAVPSRARVEDATSSQDAFDPDAWTLDPAAIPDDLRLDARELLTDEHISFLLQCLVPEARSRLTFMPAQTVVLLHGLQDDDVHAARDGRLSDALSNPSIAEVFVPLNTTLMAGLSADTGSHWVLLHLDRSGRNPPTLWDSLPEVSIGGLEVARSFMRRLRTVTGWERVADVPLLQMPYGAQHDGFQCGFFVALAARALAHGAMPQPHLARVAAVARRAFARRRPTP